MPGFLWPQNNWPISGPISYLLKGVGTFFGLANTPHQRHDLPPRPFTPRLSYSEAHVCPYFVMSLVGAVV